MRRLLFLAALPPWVFPWPVGPAPHYTPPARTAAVHAGAPVGALRCGAGGETFRVHLEVFVDRKVVIVPAGIGVSDTGCRYPVSTDGPDGIVRVAPGLRLGDVFSVWGLQLEPNRIGWFSSKTPLRAYVGGKLVHGPVRQIPLTPHAQIVLELGGYVPPHPHFLFAGGDS
jgi:hypothetical protein